MKNFLMMPLGHPYRAFFVLTSPTQGVALGKMHPDNNSPWAALKGRPKMMQRQPKNSDDPFGTSANLKCQPQAV
ncbi:hypothetical protein [Desulfonatronum thioautotrophicum]|uniref:hypothetical protein n=1 Tax=Desulfonatronum thioautotrophicum TaxID=617001 RepID=UPI0012948342|nr:hypothetical protein [Desulfonatronum thioautotrophicum]